VWEEWCIHRKETCFDNIPYLQEISVDALQYWITCFILEVRKKDGSEFSPDTLHHLCCGIQRFLRLNGHPALDIFKDSRLTDFRSSLDSEMKRLQSLGIGSKKKQSEPLTTEDEEKLWEEGLLGEHSPQTRLNTIIFMNGIYFALRSGQEHHN